MVDESKVPVGEGGRTLRKEVDLWLEFVSKTEGRDKFGKVFQFLFRFFAGVFKESNPDLSKRCEAFWRAMLDARRLQWFGKSLMELKTVEGAINNKSLPETVRYCHAGARFLFALRWAIENVMILYKIGFLQGRKWQDLNKVAKRLWSGAICLGIVTELWKLQHVKEELRLNRTTRNGELILTPENAATIREQCFRTIIQHLGDTAVPAAIGWDFALGDTSIGFLHTIAALLQSYNLYPAGSLAAKK